MKDLLKALEDALAMADKLPPSRSLAMVKTKLDEALLWGGRLAAEEPSSTNHGGC